MFSRMSLSMKFLMLLLPPLVLTFVLGAAGTAYMGYHNEQKMLREQHQVIVGMFSRSLVRPLWDCDLQTAKDISDILRYMPGVLQLRLTDDCSGSEVRWRAGDGLDKLDDAELYDRVIVYTDEYDRGFEVGRLQVWFESPTMTSFVRRQFWQYASLLVLVLSAMLLSAVLANMGLVTAPLARFKTAMQRQAKGEPVEAGLFENRKDELGEVMQTQAQLMEDMSRRDVLKETLAHCARLLLRSSGADEAVLDQILTELREAVDVDRIYIFKNTHNADGELCMSQTHEQCAPGVPSELDNPVLQELPYSSGYSRWGQLFAAGDFVAGGVDMLPPEEQSLLQDQGIKSCTAHPIWVGESWYGFIGLDDIRTSRTWSENEIVFLQTAADIIGSFLQRLETEKRLQQEREQFLNLLDGIPEVIYVADKDTHELLFANKTLLEQFGQDARGKKCHEVLQGRHTPCEFCTNGIIFSQRVPHFWQFQNPINQKYYYVIDQTITWSDGHDVRFELAIDITRLKETEEALKKSEEMYRLITENISDVIWVLNIAQDRFTYVSPSVERLRGYTAEEVMQQHWTEALTPESRSLVLESLDPRLREFEKNPDEFNVLISQQQQPCKDGSLVWVESSTRMRYTPEGEVEVLGVTRNIEERKKHEHLKEDVERILRHDLKAPLNAVICLPQLIEEEGNLTSDQKVLLAHINQQGHQMLQMINFSLDLYKLETGSYVYEPKSLCLLSILREILFNLQARQQGGGVEVQMLEQGRAVQRERSLFIPGERMLLYSLFSNLLLNAIEAAPAGSRVTVDIAMNQDCSVAIHNQGVVPEEIRHRFFEKYVTRGKTGGTGLGTYSAKLMAEIMGGSIEMQSGPEFGTVVTVHLPC